MSRRAVITGLITMGIAASAPAEASVLFSRSFAGPPSLNAYCSDCIVGGSPLGASIYDEFTLASAGNAREVDFYVSTLPGSGPPWHFQANIYAGGALPGGLIDSQVVTPASYVLSPQPNGVGVVKFDLGGVALAAGSYWISLYDSTEELGIPAWNNSPGTLLGFNGTWHPITTRSAQYTILDTSLTFPTPAPEPASLGLLGVGLLGLWSLRRAQAHRG